MGIFDFFKKTESTEDSSSKEITFNVNTIDQIVLSGCKVGDYVSLWTTPQMDNVIIYAKGSVGGSGQLGIVPNNYFRNLKAHILGAKSYGISGPSTRNYDATILSITGSSCTIGIKLYSPEEHEKRIMDMNAQAKQGIKDKLDKLYKMKKPVSIKFKIIGIKTLDLEDLKLKITNPENLKLIIFEKEYYIEHPNDYKLELRDDTNKLLAVPERSQNSSLLNIIKGHHSGQKMLITKIEIEENHLLVLISAN